MAQPAAQEDGFNSDSSPSALRVALDANAAAYRHIIASGGEGAWDYLVLTAANEKQAAGYRQELELRQRALGPAGAFFPLSQRAIVVPDPPGQRAGSGGATFGVLKALAELEGGNLDELSRRNILLIHSGGASQRLPMYSPVGKIFSPLPLLRPDGQVATLFDHLYVMLAGLADRLGPGMLVLAGDVFLLFDHRRVGAPAEGVTAISWRVAPELGSGHGVYAVDAKGRIRKTLQKVSPQRMAQEGLLNERGVLIDTGLLFFDPPRLRTLATLAGAGRRAQPIQEQFAGIDLYEDITGALAADADAKQYLADRNRRPMRRRIWNALHGTAFNIMQVEGEFLHLGTTRQFRDALTGRSDSPAATLLQQNVLTRTNWEQAADARVYHSLLLADERGAAGAVGTGAVVEHSILRGPVLVGAGSVVSQTLANGPLDLSPQRLLFQVPVSVGEMGRRVRGRSLAVAAAGDVPELTSIWYVHVLCGVEDDFKGKFAAGQCRYLNEPIEKWLGEKGVTPEELWPDTLADQRTLWNARLFPATQRRDGVSAAVAMLETGRGGRAELRAWRAGRRYSMAMLLESADPQAMIEHRDVVSARLQVSGLLQSIDRNQDIPVDSLVGRFATATAYYAALDEIDAAAALPAADSLAVLRQARALWCASQLLRRSDHPDPQRARPLAQAYRDAAFTRIAVAEEKGGAGASAAPAPHIEPNIEIVASAPVRLDFSGGWSDTPPYCFERGGHVINLAIDLDGRPPVRAVVRTFKQPKLILESHDLGQRVELSADSIDGAIDVRDPFALHKVALNMAGLWPATGQSPAALLRRLSCGLHVSTECRVPKGSGLGTSSILAATLLAALYRATGCRHDTDTLIDHTLRLEQRLSTGGGWQDQVGGIVGGLKSAASQPGLPQRPRVESLDIGDAAYEQLQERLVVYYSGQQRLARDILRRVIGRWLGREPAVVLLMQQLQRGAVRQREALLRGRWNIVAEEINRYWQLKKDLYAGSTTPAIDVLLLELSDAYQAAGMAGAGGGGFAYFLCASARAARRLRERLARHSLEPGSLGSVYQTQINRRGLALTRRRAQ